MDENKGDGDVILNSSSKQLIYRPEPPVWNNNRDKSKLSAGDKLSLRNLLGLQFHPLQPDFILAPEFEVCAVGGMGAGKTYAACVASIRHAARFPGARVLIARKTYDELVRSTKKQFFDIVERKGLRAYFDRPRNWDYREGTNYARMVNGSEFIFSNLESDIDKHKNVEYSFVFIDQVEEVDFEVYQILLVRCRAANVHHRDRHVLSVANDEGDNWIRSRFLTYEQPHGRPPRNASRRLIRGSSLDNPYLDAGARAQLFAMPTELQARYIYATMAAGTSRLIPELRIIEPFEVPRHWPRWVGVDPARSTGVTCAIWVTVNPDDEPYGGVLPNAPHFYQEYWAEGRDAEVHAEDMLKLCGPHYMKGWCVDRTAWITGVKSRKHGALSVGGLYVKAGLPAIPSEGDEWARVMLFLEAHTRGLTVSALCHNLIRQSPNYRIKGQVIREGMLGDKGLQIKDKARYHSIDAGGYALSRLPTKATKVDLRMVSNAYEIADHVDEASRKHWDAELALLPKRKGNESFITTAMDEDEFNADEVSDTKPWSQDEGLY